MRSDRIGNHHRTRHRHRGRGHHSEEHRRAREEADVVAARATSQRRLGTQREHDREEISKDRHDANRQASQPTNH